jgi:RNA polymerase sigma-70 factor (ECF subfamily)
LPREEREILFLRQWQKLSGEETIAVLGITLAAAKSRLHRARIRLAALLRSGNEGKEA